MSIHVDTCIINMYIHVYVHLTVLTKQISHGIMLDKL